MFFFQKFDLGAERLFRFSVHLLFWDAKHIRNTCKRKIFAKERPLLLEMIDCDLKEDQNRKNLDIFWKNRDGVFPTQLLGYAGNLR